MITIIQHVPYESPGWILNWLAGHSLPFRMVGTYRGDPLPAVDEVAGLVIMGGSMNVYEEKLFPWLAREKAFIRQCIQSGKQVLGICLGAQLIAASMGARVKRNSALEIGWYPVDVRNDQLPGKLRGIFPARFQTFHWHGDAFEVPADAVPFASSEACPNQGFVMGDNVLAIQFHPEMTEEGIEDLIASDGDDLFSESLFVQPAEKMREGMHHIDQNREVLFQLLTSLFQA